MAAVGLRARHRRPAARRVLRRAAPAHRARPRAGSPTRGGARRRRAVQRRRPGPPAPVSSPCCAPSPERSEMQLLLVTHDLGVAERLCDDVVVLAHGQVAEAGPIAEVFARPALGCGRRPARCRRPAARAGGAAVTTVETGGLRGLVRARWSIVSRLGELPGPMRLIVLGQLAFNTGFYLVLPFFAVHLSRDLGITGRAIGLLLGLRTFGERRRTWGQGPGRPLRHQAGRGHGLRRAHRRVRGPGVRRRPAGCSWLGTVAVGFRRGAVLPGRRVRARAPGRHPAADLTRSTSSRCSPSAARSAWWSGRCSVRPCSRSTSGSPP